MRHRRYVPVFGLASLLLTCVLGGCTSSTELTESQKQDDIMSHPMEYKPDVGGSISGGDTSNFDSKSFNHDVHDFWNP